MQSESVTRAYKLCDHLSDTEMETVLKDCTSHCQVERYPVTAGDQDPKHFISAINIRDPEDNHNRALGW